MTLRNCISTAVKAGEMSRTKANAALERLKELEEGFAVELGPGVSARMTAERVLTKEQRIVAAIRKRQKLLQAGAQIRILNSLDEFRNAKGEADRVEAAIRQVEAHGLTFSGISAEAERKAIQGRAHGRIENLLWEHKRNLVGETRNKALLSEVTREAFGENTGNASAKELAGAWLETAEFLRQKFNAAGGHIGKLDRWGLPQSHDTLKVRKAGFDDWREFIWDKLDRGRMIDGATGKAFSDAELEDVLQEVFETIRTDGFDKLRPGQAGARSVGNRRADHRFLHFKSPDDWMDYQGEFGNADPFSAMMSWIDGMSRDIGAMRTLGPNPAATVRWLGDVLEQEAALAGDSKMQNRAGRAKARLTHMYNHYTGSVNAPVDGPVARGFQAVRNVLTGAHLGSAVLSAVTDPAWMAITARINGIPQAKMVREAVRLFNPANVEDRKLAVRMGLIAEEASHVAAAQMRYVGEVNGPEVSRRISDFVLRSSGLSPWTQTNRWVFGMSVLGHAADEAGKPFAKLDDRFADLLHRYGIDAEAWDVIRKTEMLDHDGARFLRPEDIAARTDIDETLADDLATKLLALVQTETEFAVPSVSIRGKSLFMGSAEAGTIPGELMRSTVMYKSFAITMMFTHMRRVMELQGASKLEYAAGMFIGGAILGAFALQMKEIAKGRDPKPMDSPAFWGAASLQGGGLGIFGDFLLQDSSRFGHSFGTTVAGPVVGAISDLHGLTIGNAMQGIRGEDMKLGDDLARFVGRYTPGASLWYARLALQRGVLDQLRLWADPAAGKRMRRADRKLRKSNNQGLWWRQGEFAPDRAPDLGNALGDKK